jgi:hypothetical protein
MTDLTADVKSRSSTEGCLVLCWKSETGDRDTEHNGHRSRLKMTTLDVFNIDR